MASSGPADNEPGSSPDYRHSLSANKRLIFQNMKFWLSELQASDALINQFESLRLAPGRCVFPPEQVQDFRRQLVEYRDNPVPCREMNKLIVDKALRLDDRGVYDFLRCLERDEPNQHLALRVLRGKTVEEISHGSLSAVDHEPMDVVAQLLPKSPSEEYGRPNVSFEEFMGPIEPEEADGDDEDPSGPYQVGPEGGKFEFSFGDIILVVPAGALDAVVKIDVGSSVDVGEDVKLPDGSRAYISQALSFQPHQLQFKLPVSVSVGLGPAFRKKYKEVKLYWSDTGSDECPKFMDVSAETSRACIDHEKKRVTFELQHFSTGRFAAGLALVGAVLTGYLAIRKVRLDIGAFYKEEEYDKRITLRLQLVPNDSPEEPVWEEGKYRRVNSLAQSIQMACYDWLDVSLEKNNAPGIAEPWSCGEGGCWSHPRQYSVPEMQIGVTQFPTLDKRTVSRRPLDPDFTWNGCQVIAAGAFVCKTRWHTTTVPFQINTACQLPREDRCSEAVRISCGVASAAAAAHAEPPPVSPEACTQDP